MANVHINADNGAGVSTKSSDFHLASMMKQSSHLVVVKQNTDWTNKEFVVPPKQAKYTAACAWGIEANRGTTGGSSVKNDTAGMITTVKNLLDNATWVDGDKALFSYFNRACDVGYMSVKGCTTSPDFRQMSGHGKSCVAWKFDLRHLHFSKMSAFTAYLRVWQPSLLHKDMQAYAPTYTFDWAAIAGRSDLLNNASHLRVKLVKQLPTKSTGIDADGSEDFNFTTSNCNDRSPRSDDTIIYGALHYDPFGFFSGTLSTSTINIAAYNPVMVYLCDDDSSNRQVSKRPQQKRYYDFQFTCSQQLDLLKTNPGEVWLMACFHAGNAFSTDTTGVGMKSELCACCYAQRVELVFKCTGTKFNKG